MPVPAPVSPARQRPRARPPYSASAFNQADALDAVEPRRFRALILDDDEVDRRRLRSCCQKIGLKCEMVEADDLATFAAALDDQAFDLVFIDQNLGGESGLDALSALVAHPDQSTALPIMVTGIDRHDIVIESMRKGAADYIVKDELTEDMLRKSITSAFERQVMVAAVSQARHLQAAVRRSLARFSASCGRETRDVVFAALRHSRSLRQRFGNDQAVARDLGALESSCCYLSEFLSDMGQITRAAQLDRVPSPPLPSLLEH